MLGFDSIKSIIGIDDNQLHRGWNRFTLGPVIILRKIMSESHLIKDMDSACKDHELYNRRELRCSITTRFTTWYL